MHSSNLYFGRPKKYNFTIYAEQTHKTVSSNHVERTLDNTTIHYWHLNNALKLTHTLSISFFYMKYILVFELVVVAYFQN